MAEVVKATNASRHSVDPVALLRAIEATRTPVLRSRTRTRTRWTDLSLTPDPGAQVRTAELRVREMQPGDVLAGGHHIKEVAECGAITDIRFAGEVGYRTFDSSQRLTVTRAL